MGPQNFHIKIGGDRKDDANKIHTEDPQIFGATQHLDAWATRRL